MVLNVSEKALIAAKTASRWAANAYIGEAVGGIYIIRCFGFLTLPHAEVFP